MAKKKVSQKDTPRQETPEDSLTEVAESLKGELQKLSGMKFTDFRQRVVAFIGDICETIEKSIEWYANDRDGYLDTITKRFESTDEVIKKISSAACNRFENLEHVVFVMAISFLEHTQGTPASHDQKKGISGLLGYDWDKTLEDLSIPGFAGTFTQAAGAAGEEVAHGPE